MPIHSRLPSSWSNWTRRRSSSPWRWGSVTGKITVPDRVRLGVAVDGHRHVAGARADCAAGRGGRERRLRHQLELARGGDHALAERDRAEMWPSPTARSDMTMRTAPFLMPALVGMGNDARVHQRRGGIAIFVAEIGADQLLARVADRPAWSPTCAAISSNRAQEHLARLPVARLEIAIDQAELGAHGCGCRAPAPPRPAGAPAPARRPAACQARWKGRITTRAGSA